MGGPFQGRTHGVAVPVSLQEALDIAALVDHAAHEIGRDLRDQRLIQALGRGLPLAGCAVTAVARIRRAVHHALDNAADLAVTVRAAPAAHEITGRRIRGHALSPEVAAIGLNAGVARARSAAGVAARVRNNDVALAGKP